MGYEDRKRCSFACIWQQWCRPGPQGRVGHDEKAHTHHPSPLPTPAALCPLMIQLPDPDGHRQRELHRADGAHWAQDGRPQRVALGHEPQGQRRARGIHHGKRGLNHCTVCVQTAVVQSCFDLNATSSK